MCYFFKFYYGISQAFSTLYIGKKRRYLFLIKEFVLSVLIEVLAIILAEILIRIGESILSYFFKK